MSPDTRLAVYGTLAPGQANHGELAGLRGTWRPGRVTGTLVEHGWGAALGYPMLILRRDGAHVAVQIFDSADLPGHWDRLDAFEGAGYHRVTTQVETRDGPVDAWIYVGAGEPG